MTNEWQPIETAPKDGTTVIVLFYRPNVFEGPGTGHQNWVTLAKYDADDPPLGPSAWQNIHGQGFKWTPTHWVPQPKLPA